MPLTPHALRRTIAWNTVSQLVGRAVSAIATLVITILIARKFGTNGYGDFVKITTFVAFFYLLADFGFNAIYLQRSANAGTSDTNWNDLLGLRLLASSVLVFVALAILALIPQGATQGYTQTVRIGIILFVPTIVFQALTTTANALFQKQLRYDLSTGSVIAGSIVSLGLVWLTTYGKSSSILLSIFSLFIGAATTALLGLWLAKKYSKGIYISFSLPHFRSLFFASLPLGVTLLFNLVYFHIDSVVLTLTRPTAEVGIYGLVYKIFELPLVIPTFFMNSLYPVMIETKQLLILFKKSVIALSLVSGIATVVVWLGAPLVVFVKADFAPGVDALRILSLGFPFFFLSSLTMWTLITKKRQVLLMYIYGASMLLNICLNIMYVPTYGYMAAAWITVVSEAVVLVLSGIAVWRML